MCEKFNMSTEDLAGENLYNCCHAEDLQKLRKAHVDRKYSL